MSSDAVENAKFECKEETYCKSESDDKKNSIQKWLKENLLLLLTLLGVVSGIIIGSGLRPLNPSENTILIISYPGELFMRILKLLILPLIISSLIAGSASLNAKLNGRIAIRTLLYFLVTSSLNAALGVLLAVLFHPGRDDSKIKVARTVDSKGGSTVLDSFLDLGRNIVADNIFQATFQQTFTGYTNITSNNFNEDGTLFNVTDATVRTLKYRSGINTLGIVLFCLMFGTILGTLGRRSKIVVDFFNIIFEAVMKMVSGVIWITPFGICSIITGKILSASNLALIISQLGWFIATVIVGVFFYQLIVMQLIYFVFVRKNPFKFYLGLVQGTLTAFATASTAAALPVTFTLMDDKVKVDTRITRFVLPIGCNINMNGTAMFLAISSIFVAQMNGIQLDAGKLATVFVTSTAASFSSASVPSAALVLLLMVLAAIDTPINDVSLLFAVDWLVDRFRTTNNMLGDCYTAAIVEKLSKKELMAWDAILTQDSTHSNGYENHIKKENTKCEDIAVNSKEQNAHYPV